MSKHTAGPWTCETSLERWGEYFIPQIAADIIAMDDLESDEPVGQNETDEANARLIAAAPELLEALKGCVNHLEQIAKRDYPYANTMQRRFNSTRAALAAITKATQE